MIDVELKERCCSASLLLIMSQPLVSQTPAAIGTCLLSSPEMSYHSLARQDITSDLQLIKHSRRELCTVITLPTHQRKKLEPQRSKFSPVEMWEKARHLYILDHSLSGQH